MTKIELQKHLKTCHILIDSILSSIKLAEEKNSKAKFRASVKELERRIADYNKIPKT